MRARRKEFSDRKKAAIFVRDRATCCFSGKSLWLLDYGGGPSTTDWVDHVVPASRGGGADLDNGACASWVFNKVRGTGQVIRLFADGYPTQDWFTLFEVVPRSIASRLQRFANLHPSDWYFNRAVFQVQHGAALTAESRRRDRKSRRRGPDYWGRAAFGYLATWREIVAAECPASMKARGLLPSRPSADQKVLLRLVEAKSADDVGALVEELSAWSAPSWDALASLAHVRNQREARELLRDARSHPFVTDRVKRAIATNVELLWP